MAQESFHNHLRLKPDERSKLLCRLDDAPTGRVGRDRRRYKRWEFRLSDIAVLVQHPGGGVGRYLVCARNISAGGVSFIHGGYIHPGSECKIVLPRRDGAPLPVNGEIVYCRHVEGSYHEVGVRFTQEVDPALLLEDPTEEAEARDQTRELPALKGRLLVVDQSKSDRRLMTHQLAATGLHLTMVDSPGAAIDSVRRRAYEILLCDLNLENDAVRMIGQIRKAEFRGPIIVITAETSPERLGAARSAGANEIIGKPYDPVYLASLLAEWLEVPGIDRPIYSSFEDKPGMAELIADFVGDARGKAHQIEKGLEEEGLPGMREVCLELIGSGAGHGFDSVTEAARDALTALETSQKPGDGKGPLRRLMLICQQLRCGNSVRPMTDSGGQPKNQPG